MLRLLVQLMRYCKAPGGNQRKVSICCTYVAGSTSKCIRNVNKRGELVYLFPLCCLFYGAISTVEWQDD
jgi:hypothetical protein